MRRPDAMIRSAFYITWMILLVALTACRGEETEIPAPTEAPLSGESLQARTFDALWEAVRTHYIHYPMVEEDWQAVYDASRPRVDRGDPDEFQEVIEAALDALPEGEVSWDSREERIERERLDTQAYDGIGAYIGYRESPEPHIVLLSVVSGSPAQAAGLSPHDSVIAIDGVDIGGEEGIRAVDRIRGPSGSQVVLTVRSPGEPPREVSVQRESLVATGEIRSARFQDSDLGYILFPPTAYDGMIDDFLAHLRGATGGGADPLDGLILDLRVAGTGLAWPLEEMMALFMDGEAGEFITAEGVTEIQVEGQDAFDSQTVPLVVLIGPDTQGWPEIFAASVQADGRGTLIGLPTIGAVEGSRDFPLPDGSVALISTVSFVTALGQDIGLTGVTPEVEVQADWDEVSEGQDAVIDRAIEVLGSPGP